MKPRFNEGPGGQISLYRVSFPYISLFHWGEEYRSLCRGLTGALHLLVLSCFSQDIGTQTPDKNMITLFLSYLYQSVEKGANSVEIAWKEGSHSEVTRKVSGFQTFLYSASD